MRRLLHGAAIVGLVGAGVLGMLGVAAWPPGGLMFALPYFLLFMAGVVGAGSGILFLLTKPAGKTPTETEQP